MISENYLAKQPTFCDGCGVSALEPSFIICVGEPWTSADFIDCEGLKRTFNFCPECSKLEAEDERGED